MTPRPQLLRQLLSRREYGVFLLLAVTVLVVSLVNRDFVSIQNIRDMLIKAAPTIIVACGLTLVIVTGEIDISVGSLMGLCAAVMGICASSDHLGWPVWIVVGIVVLLGAIIGLINGFLVTIGRVPSIIVTLGMLTALRGTTDLLMAGEWIQNMPESLRFIGTGGILGMPISVLIALIVVVLFMIIMIHTPLGRRIYAVGSNPRSAHLAGISQRNVKLIVFTVTGILTGVATLISATQLRVVEAGFGVNVELLVVTCVVVGGTSISGGRGTIIGSVLGVLLLSIIGTVLIFLKLGADATYWAGAIQGGFILLAVLMDHLVRKKSEAHA